MVAYDEARQQSFSGEIPSFYRQQLSARLAIQRTAVDESNAEEARFYQARDTFYQKVRAAARLIEQDQKRLQRLMTEEETRQTQSKQLFGRILKYNDADELVQAEKLELEIERLTIEKAHAYIPLNQALRQFATTF